MINIPFLKKWAEILPEYKQGSNFLRPTEDTYCCLGVACELYKQETGLGEWRLLPVIDVDKDRYRFVTNDYHTDQDAATLPLEVQRYIGLSPDGAYTTNYSTSFIYITQAQQKHKTLSSMNDSGYDFSSIREAILRLVAYAETEEAENAQ